MSIVEEYQIVALIAMLFANMLMATLPYLAVKSKDTSFDYKYVVYALLGVILAMPAYLPQLSGGTYVEVFFQAAAYSLTAQFAIEKGAKMAARLKETELGPDTP